MRLRAVRVEDGSISLQMSAKIYNGHGIEVGDGWVMPERVPVYQHHTGTTKMTLVGSAALALHDIVIADNPSAEEEK